MSETEKTPLSEQMPDGYAHKYHGYGGDVIRFNEGQEVNGSKPFGCVPYYFEETFAALERENNANKALLKDAAMQVTEKEAEVTKLRVFAGEVLDMLAALSLELICRDWPSVLNNAQRKELPELQKALATALQNWKEGGK